jgi:penicillin amidase
MKQLIATQIVNEKSPWWDNVETKKQERSDQILKSFKEAIAVLEKTIRQISSLGRGIRYMVEYEHYARKNGLLRRIFNEFEVSGSKVIKTRCLITQMSQNT